MHQVLYQCSDNYLTSFSIYAISIISHSKLHQSYLHLDRALRQLEDNQFVHWYDDVVTMETHYPVLHQ